MQLGCVAVLAALALGPAFRRGGAATWWRAHARALGAAVGALGLVWGGRVLVPPAPLFLPRAFVARGGSEMHPPEPAEYGRLSAATVLEWGEVAAYTAVYAPA